MQIHLFYTCLHNSSEGMFFCWGLNVELYILSSFFVRDVYNVTSCMHVYRRVQSKRFLIVVNMGS